MKKKILPLAAAFCVLFSSLAHVFAAADTASAAGGAPYCEYVIEPGVVYAEVACSAEDARLLGADLVDSGLASSAYLDGGFIPYTDAAGNTVLRLVVIVREPYEENSAAVVAQLGNEPDAVRVYMGAAGVGEEGMFAFDVIVLTIDTTVCPVAEAAQALGGIDGVSFVTYDVPAGTQEPSGGETGTTGPAVTEPGTECPPSSPEESSCEGSEPHTVGPDIWPEDPDVPDTEITEDETCAPEIEETQTPSESAPDEPETCCPEEPVLTEVPATEEATTEGPGTEDMTVPEPDGPDAPGSGRAIIILTLSRPTASDGLAVMSEALGMDCVVGAAFEPVSGGTGYVYGDADLDGDLTADDARTVLRIAIELILPESYLRFVLADMDCDGAVSSSDARLVLRAAIGLDPKNYYPYPSVEYQGLIAGKSVGLSKNGGKLVMTASTVGSARVTRCGFNYVKLQKLTDGLWTDVPGYVFTELYGDSSSKVFSKAAEVGHGTYRVVCEHYAETPSAYYTVQSAVFYEASEAVTI
ncbi:MAG: hypothetical protein K6C36_03415 [Clostridia bacterium]|nr:hypothetical protein [Clostridia bacterium]